jgi:EmrB/QacA subfamily drug resistance transporter
VTALIVLTGVFLSSLDLFIVNIAFPSISSTFHGESLSSLSWVLSAYTIVFAAALVPAGRWADRAGRKRAFLLGLAIFTASSALCAVAPSLEFLVGARVLQAFGGALMLPTSLGLLLPAFGPARKGAAIGLWSAVGGAAAAFGPPIGGLLVQVSWRWVFLVNLPFSVLALIFGLRVLEEVRDPVAHKSDLFGAALLSISVASAVAAIVQGSTWGWTSPRIIGAFVLAVAAATGLVLRSSRHPNPIVEPAVIRHRAVALADLSSLVFFGGFGALVLGGVLLLTGVWHESVLRAGFMIGPGPLLAGLTALPAGLLGARLGHRAVGVAGSLLFAAGGLWWITHVTATPDWVGAYLPGSVVSGIGVGLMLPSLGGAATAPLPPQRFATGSALYAMTRQIGIALGVACLVAILGTATGPSAVEAFRHAWIFMIGCSLLAGAVLVGIGARQTETADAGAVPLDEELAPTVAAGPVPSYAVAGGK